jgi:D-aspartate ligase
VKIANTSIPVLVLGATQHGSLGIIRSLGELGIPVYATYSGRPGPATCSRFCKGRFEWTFLQQAQRESLSRLIEIGNRIGTRSILIPTWDETAVFASEYYSALQPWFIFPQQPVNLAKTLVNKMEMSGLARRCGIPTAEIFVPESVEQVRQFASKAQFPILLKGIDGNRLKQRTGRKMVIVRTSEELVRLYLEMEDPEAPNLMLQEYLVGDHYPDWMFNGYFDGRSDCLMGFTGRKLRQTPVYIGMTSLGECVSNAQVTEQTVRWMKQIGYRGILDIGYRFDRHSNEYKVLDVNPRIGATFRLFVGDNGLDVARALYLDLTCQPVPVTQSCEGRKWMVELDFRSSLQYYCDQRLTVLQWILSLRGIQELGYFRRDDLWPLVQAGLVAFGYLLKLARIRMVRVTARGHQRSLTHVSVKPADTKGGTHLSAA